MSFWKKMGQSKFEGSKMPNPKELRDAEIAKEKRIDRAMKLTEISLMHTETALLVRMVLELREALEDASYKECPECGCSILQCRGSIKLYELHKENEELKDRIKTTAPQSKESERGHND